jgi:hypothetical protein
MRSTLDTHREGNELASGRWRWALPSFVLAGSVVGLALGAESEHLLEGFGLGVAVGLSVGGVVHFAGNRPAARFPRGAVADPAKALKPDDSVVRTWKAAPGASILAGAQRWVYVAVLSAPVTALLLIASVSDPENRVRLLLGPGLAFLPVLAFAIWRVCTSRVLREFRLRNDGTVELVTASHSRRVQATDIRLSGTGYGVLVPIVRVPSQGLLRPSRYYFHAPSTFISESGGLSGLPH